MKWCVCVYSAVYGHLRSADNNQEKLNSIVLSVAYNGLKSVRRYLIACNLISLTLFPFITPTSHIDTQV